MMIVKRERRGRVAGYTPKRFGRSSNHVKSFGNYFILTKQQSFGSIRLSKQLQMEKSYE